MTSRPRLTPSPKAEPADVAAAEPQQGWQPLRPRTLVDAVIDEVIAAAASGRILPGDRIVEAELAQGLGISRVPVREALRILESQGLVVNEPYKGIRLRTVTQERIDHLIEARVALETTAATRAILAGRNGTEEVQILHKHVDELDLMRVRGDAYGFATADTSFHRALCQFSGNEVICDLWDMLSRQLTIIVGLSTFGKAMSDIVNEHRILIKVFESGDVTRMAQALDDHINVQTHAVDFQGIIERHRTERTKRSKT
ncbi:GntR family transcriptional regulator [Microvirga alba]|uniref:GntR family transcriptional regulator n=1 Tax=Microvirga alba TaxID=2791025 RepID=A0A931BU17_9HYPH|nr:GntR family transcriptional regulator [Microvirga alba]MBF9232817.1 GntR family transcriptional regulator [Microvirga alba]